MRQTGAAEGWGWEVGGGWASQFIDRGWLSFEGRGLI